jgi:MFS family permease
VTAIGEFRSSWSNLLGTCFGLGSGAALSFYTMSIFGPALIADLGWSRADFALVGSLSLLSMPILPFTGRFIDRVGPRIAGAAGFSVLTLCFVALSMMNGPFWQYLVINFFVSVFGVMTSSMVFARVIVDRFDHARGLALSIMMSASPLSGAIAAPLIGGIIAAHGWRSGYLVLAAISAVGGLLAIALSGNSRAASPKSSAAPLKFTRAELMTIVRNPVFPLLIVGMFLVNVPQVLAQSQLKLVIMGTGIPGATATWMVSLYAIGVVVGRCGCGIALDRVKTHVVAFITLGLPTVSYVLLAGEITATSILVPAILLIGLAQGAEGDVGAFIISRRFDQKNFSLLYAFLNIMVSTGSSIGALMLSFTLLDGTSYAPFSIVCAVTAFAGAVLFGLTGLVGHGREKNEKRDDAEEVLAESNLTGESG